MADLHERLVAAVNARLEVAQAYLGACGGSHGWCGDECEEFQQAGDPDSVIRHCERDLRVLERHAPVHIGGPAACKHAWADSDGWIEDYPCDEVRDLATAYGVEADHA